MKIFLLIPLLLSTFANGQPKTIRVAGIYPTHDIGHFNCTCGMEGACITEAVVKRAQKEGMNISFNLVNKDWDALKTLEASEEVASKKFDVAVGTLVSNDALVAATILEKAKIPFVVPTATHPDITAGKLYVTRIPFNDRRQAALLAKLATDDLKAQRIVIVRDVSTPYSDFLGKEFAKNIRTLSPQGSVSDHAVYSDFSDYNTLIKKIMSAKPDLLFLPLSQLQLASIYVKLAELNVSLTILCSDTIEKTPKFLEMMQPASKKIRFIYPKHWNERFEGPEVSRYQSLHKKYCSQYPTSMTTVAAYDAMEIVIRALKKDPTVRGQRLIQLIRKMPYHGMTGILKYGPDGDPIKPIELYHLNENSVLHWKRYE